MQLKVTSLLFTLLFFACLLQATPPVPPPLNDNCANASAIVVGGGGYALGTYTSITSDLTSATVEPGETFYSTISSAGQNRKSVWFKFSLPTARRCTLFVKQPTPVIASNDVGFTIYKANACFPTSIQADSALLAAQTVFGYSTNPCMKPGDYMVQVSSNNNANGPIFLQLELDTPSPGPYDFPNQAYDFGILSNCSNPVNVSMGCQSLDNSTEVCPAIGANYLDYTQSIWLTFTTPAYLDWLGVAVGPSSSCCFTNSPTTFAYNLYRGDAKVTAISSLTLIDGCVVDTFNNYGSWFNPSYECSILPNTIYSIQLFFHKDLTDNVQVQVQYMGTAASQGTKPLTASVAPINKLGVLPAGGTSAGDYFGCNSRLSINPCGQTNPATGVYCSLNSSTYSLNDWFTFELSQSSLLSINAYPGNGNGYFVRLFNKDINASCANFDTTANLYTEFLGSTNLNCVPPGKYSLQIMGNDDPTPYWGYACVWRDNLSQRINLNLNVTPVPVGSNHYSLAAAGRVDTVNNVSNTYGALQDGVTYNSDVDSFGCNNTVMPDSNLCDPRITKAMYFEFKIGDANSNGQPDSGVLTIHGNFSWNYWHSWNILYKGDANALATAQNRHAYPNVISGLTPITPCFGNNNWCGVETRVCVTPGTYTMVDFGDSTIIGQTTSFNFTENLVTTIHRSGPLAQNMGSLIDTLAGSGGVGAISSDVDHFTCLDNADTIGGQAPCIISNGVPATKAIYREFYLSTPALLTLYSTANSCPNAGALSMFYGKASNGLNTLTPVGTGWTCFYNANTDVCHPFPAGWYTVVSYGEGPTYGNSSPFAGARGNGGDIGLANQITITVSQNNTLGPKYNRPYKAAIDTNTHLPFVIRPAVNAGTAAYPQTDTTYSLYTEYYNCITDTPFSTHPVVPCTSAYQPNRVTYYTFTLPQMAYIHISGLSGAMAEVFPFNVRTDSARMLTTNPIQPCISNGDYIELCRLQAGTYTLVVFPPDWFAGGYITPTIYVDKVGYSRFDHANKAYDFGLVPMDSAWHFGKVGDVNPLNSSRSPSDDFFYCTTSAESTDPANVCGVGAYDPYIYDSINNIYNYDVNNPANYPRRNLWYTFVLDKGGNCTVGINPKTADKTQQYPFTIYKSSVNGNLPFSTVVSSGLLDSTTTGLTPLVNNQPYWWTCYLTNQVTFSRDPCNPIKERYYILVDNYQGVEPNSELDVQILYDTVSSTPVHYDHYSQANVINGLNQTAPPYTNLAIDTGTFHGATDNFTCATFDATDYDPCGCTDKDVWYKFTVSHAGYVRLRYTINGADQSSVDGCQMVFLQQAIAGDSTSTGLTNLGGVGNNYYDNNLGIWWYQSCIAPGTYYLLMTGCNRTTENVQPIIQLVRDSARYDHYSQANVINGLNQTGPPYTNNAISDGTYQGATGNYTCATYDATDYAPCGAEKDLWYKVTFNGSGSVRLRYSINGANQYYVDGCQMLWLKQNIVGDSTTTGLTNLGGVGSNYYDPNLNIYWYQTCVTPGTYYILMTGFNRSVEDEQPFISFTTDSGDYCSLPVSRTLNGAGSVTMSAVIDCHTIGEGFGEDGSNMGCLIPAGNNVTQYKSTWFQFTITGTDTFDITPILTNNTNASANEVRYRLMYGTCAAMNTGSCFTDANTVNTFNCLAAGTYYIQVVEPVTQFTYPYSAVTGTINVQINAVRSSPGCIPVNNCFVVANFATNSPCNTDSVYFINQSTAGDSIHYTWNFGFGGTTSTVKNPVIDFPTPLLTQNFSVLLVVNNVNCHKIDSVRQTITVKKKPHLNLGPDTTLCSPNTITLHATTYAGTGYLWQDGSTDSTYLVTTTGQYIATDTFNGCSVTDTANVTINPQPTAILGSNVTLCPGQQYSVNLYQGLGESYLWNNGFSGSYYVTDTPGIHSVKVYVGNCIARDTITISSIAAVHPIHNDTVICNGGTLLLNATTAGATTYSWDDGTTGSTRLINSSGVYWVDITIGSCTLRDSAIVNTAVSAIPHITGDSLICPSGDSAILDAGAGFTSYHWSNGKTTQTITVLTGGTYRVTVGNANGCQTSDSFKVHTSPSMTLTSIDTNVSCFGGSNGKINLTVTGGTSPLSYLWNGGAITQNRTNLIAGTYLVTVTDFAGCKAFKTDTIKQPALLKDTLTQTSVLCFGGSNGTITNTPSGGTTPYTYNWGGGIISQNRTNLVIGTYSATVTDKNSCTATASTTVTQPTQLTATKVDTAVSCFGGNNGRINITASGGVTGYTYSWSNSATTSILTNLVAAIYTVTVKDANNCSISLSDTIRQPSIITITPVINNIACSGGNTGSITLTITGGTPGYIYSWAGGVTTKDRTNLSIGNYPITVTDTNSCTAANSYSITQSAALAIGSIDTNVSCFNGNNGSIHLTVTGGNTPYTYHWNNGDTTKNKSNLIAGIYLVTVTDNSNCTSTHSDTITQPTQLQLGVTDSNVTCNGGSNGKINLTVTGGTPGYSYHWSNSSIQQNLSNLTANSYTVTVTDSKSCSSTLTTSISQPSPLQLSFVSTNVLCNGGANGAIILTVTGGSGADTYNWGAGVTTVNRTNLTAGIYTVTVTDSLACQAVKADTITQPSPLLLSLSDSNITCNGANNGQVISHPSGGSGFYSYAWNTSATTPDLAGLSTGTYILTLTDAHTCFVIDTGIVTEPLPLKDTIYHTNESCFGATTGTITLTPSGGTSPYTYQWNDASTNQNRTALAAGVYSVTITDKNHCKHTASDSITQPAALLVTLADSAVTCFGYANGKITATASGGTPGYHYAWSNAASSSTVSNVIAGVYTLTVSDTSNCFTIKHDTIHQPAAILITPTVTNVSCNGGNNGAITLTVTGGTPGYTYNWQGGITTQNRTTLIAGNYFVTVTDTLNCIATDSIPVSQPASMAVTSIDTNERCFNGNNGSIHLTITGGTLNYTYSWNDGTVTKNRTNIIAGIYTVTITDNSGCSITKTDTITQPTLLQATKADTNVSCAGGSNGRIGISVTGGTPNYTFHWNNSATTQNLSSLIVGNYSVTITDANGCTTAQSSLLTAPASLSIITIDSSSNCAGNAVGSITATVSGGVGTYTYLWNNAATTSSINNLIPGNYSLTVTDSNLCTAIHHDTIHSTTSSIQISSAQTNVSCFGLSDGSIRLTVTNGASPYAFHWNIAQTNDTITNLANGIYIVTVTDVNQCTATKTDTITQPTQLLLTLSDSNITCNGANNGQVISHPSGGTPIYTYAWSTTTTTPSLAGLSAGTYILTLTDAHSCSVVDTGIVTEPLLLQIASIDTNVRCPAGADGSITLTVSGGTTNYIYHWNTTQTTGRITALTAAIYTVTVTDAHACTAIKTDTITQPVNIQVAQADTNVSCHGGADGSVTLTVTGGTAGYVYNWNNSATTARIQNLAAGTFHVTITDTLGCVKTDSSVITQPSSIAITSTDTNVTCNGFNNGIVHLSVTGGTPNYSYNWSNSGTTKDLAGLAPNTYTVTVTDANSCTATYAVTITEPNAIQLATIDTNPLCFGSANGSIHLTPTGGTQNYTYNWSNGLHTQSILNLVANIYSVTVLDANNCSVTKSDTLVSPTALQISDTIQNVSCHGGNNGRIALNVTGGTTGYTYLWSNTGTTSVINNLIVGNYSVTVTDAHNCTISKTDTIHQPAALAIAFADTNVSCHGLSNGQVYSTATGGVPNYSYQWNVAGNASSLTGLAANTYSLTVTDANLCSTTSSTTVTEPAVLNLTVTPTNELCHGASTGSVALTVAGGTLNYIYLWSNGALTQNINTLVVNTYKVTVTDAHNCTATDSAVITQPSAIQLSVADTNVTCFNGTNGAVYLSPTGGLPNYTYNWSNAAITQNNIGIAAGKYYVTVTDANLCTATDSTTITQPLQITVNFTQDSTSCFNTADGGFQITVVGGNPGYAFHWSNNSTNQNLTNVIAGAYTLTVTDTTLCTIMATNNVPAPASINIAPTVTNVLCFGQSNGGITLNITGGVPNYSYLWNTTATTSSINTLPMGTYSVTVSDAHNCSTSSGALLVNQPDSIVLSDLISDETCASAKNGSIILSVHGGTIPYQYSWSDNVTAKDRSNLSAGLYAVTVVDANNCTDTLSATIIELNKLALSATLVNPVCPPIDNGSIQLFVTGNTAPYRYLWSNAATNNPITNLGSAIYGVTVTDSLGCTIDSAFTLQYNFVLSLNTITAQTIKLGDSVSLNTTTNGTKLSYLWTPATGLSCDTCANPVALPAVATTYQVVGTSDSGCVASDTVTITVIPYYDIFIPNAFSPNNDGNNDFWEIFGNKPGIKKLHVMVLDRWGEKVFDTSDTYFKWDGRYKGELVNPGVFVYVMQVTFLNNHVENSFKGSITVVR